MTGRETEEITYMGIDVTNNNSALVNPPFLPPQNTEHCSQNENERCLVPLHDALRNAEEPLEVQVLTPNKYGSVQNLVHMYSIHRHGQIKESNAFKRGDHRGMRWSQIKYIYNHLECVKKERSVDDVTGAKILDDERGSRSMNEYVKWLRGKNVNLQRRKRQRGDLL